MIGTPLGLGGGPGGWRCWHGEIERIWQLLFVCLAILIIEQKYPTHICIEMCQIIFRFFIKWGFCVFHNTGQDDIACVFFCCIRLRCLIRIILFIPIFFFPRLHDLLDYGIRIFS